MLNNPPRVADQLHGNIVQQDSQDGIEQAIAAVGWAVAWWKFLPGPKYPKER